MEFKEVKVCVFDITAFDEPSEFEKAYLAVDEVRRKKVDAYRLKKDKKLSLAAGILLKNELLTLGVEDFQIEYNSSGKPYLRGLDDIFFNLSHGGKYAVLAIYNKEVGIDIQEIADVSDKVMRIVCDDLEFEFLMSLEKEKRMEQFARLWTAKESFVKREGSGFKISPTELCVKLSEKISIERNGKKENVTFKEFSLQGHKLTVCY